MTREIFTDEGLLIGFLQQRYKNRGHSYLDRPSLSTQLPNSDDFPGGGTLTLFRDQVKKWADDYAMLVAFAAHVCRVPLQDFGPIHMMQYLSESRKKP